MAQRKKLDKAVVLYFPPKEIGTEKGAHCGACMMFVKNHCTVVQGSINGENGVCGLYVHGEHMGPDMKGMMPKEVAGYIDGTSSDGSGGTGGKAPTHCGNCRYFHAGECDKVEGEVEEKGCCNAWDSADYESMSEEEFMQARRGKA